MRHWDSGPVIEDAIGQVKFFKSTEEYGFIKVFTPDKYKDDVYFHASEYKADNIDRDSWFEFDIIDGNSGKKAINMRRVSQPPEHELTGTSFNY